MLGGGGGGHSKACLPKLALPWMKQFIVRLCSCLSSPFASHGKDHSFFTLREGGGGGGAGSRGFTLS